MDNTRETATVLIHTMIRQGFEPPPGLLRDIDGAADSWARLLNFAGLYAREAGDALFRYIVEPNATQYRKPWPDVGMLVARSDPGRLAASLGTDADCDKAWARFHRRMLDLLPDGPASPADLHPVDAHGAALWAGLKAMGGVEAFRMSKPDDPWPVKAWKAGYREERRRQANEPREVRRMLMVEREPKMLESGK